MNTFLFNDILFFINLFFILKLGEKPYECKFCKRPFRDRSNLLKHEEIHEETKKYECMMCNKKYAHKRSLRDHLKTH